MPLLLAMVTSLILGMGMPTTPAYLVEVALVIPALISMGIPVIIAHLFAFYFACISLITPPVAITAYAAAAIAGADVWKTGWKAFQLGIAAYIVPYMFVFNPGLLLIGPTSEVVVARCDVADRRLLFSVRHRGLSLEQRHMAGEGVCRGCRPSADTAEDEYGHPRTCTHGNIRHDTEGEV